MPTVSTWEELVAEVTPFLASSRPLDALRAAGHDFGGDVAAGVAAHDVPPVVDPELLDRLVAEYGPPPPVRLHVGPVPQVVARRQGGYSAVASVNLRVLNDALAALWEVGRFPQQAPDTLVRALLSIDFLRDTCTGVPADADIGSLHFTGPPVLAGSADTPRNVRLSLPISLDLAGTTPASLVGVAHVELELRFAVTNLKVILSPDSYAPPANIVGVTLEVHSSSPLQPASVDGHHDLEDKVRTAVNAVLVQLFQYRHDFGAPGQFTPSKRFPNSKVTVTDAGAVITRHEVEITVSDGFDRGSGSGGSTRTPRVPLDLRRPTIGGVGTTVARNLGGRFRGRVDLGSSTPRMWVDHFKVGVMLNASPDEVGDPAGLVDVALPPGYSNLHVVVDEDAATDVLTQMIESGDLDRFFNRVLGRAVDPFDHAPIEVRSGQVTFESGLVRIMLDCRAVDACVAKKDLGFKATISGPLTVADGTITFDSSSVDFDLDNTDALVCMLGSGLLGPFSVVVYAALLTVIAAYNPAGKDMNLKSNLVTLVPGTEKQAVVRIDRLQLDPGTLTVDGAASIDEATDQLFAYLRIVRGWPFPEPLGGVTVELLELDAPPPPGDDSAIPADVDRTTAGDATTIRERGSFEPSPDQSLGSAVTDDDGIVSFASVVAPYAGVYTLWTLKTATATGAVVTSSSEDTVVLEPLPDLGITVTAADGTVLVNRMPIAVNVEQRLGTRLTPFTVRLPSALVDS